MQQCNGMWIVCRSRWNLCQRTVSEQGTVDSCQHQHTPGEGKVGRQSWALKRKRTRSPFTPTALRLVRQTDTRIFTHLHTCTDIGGVGMVGRKEEVLEGGGLIRPLNVLIKQLHSISLWFLDLMNDIWKTSLILSGSNMDLFFWVSRFCCLLDMTYYRYVHERACISTVQPSNHDLKRRNLFFLIFLFMHSNHNVLFTPYIKC